MLLTFPLLACFCPSFLPFPFPSPVPLCCITVDWNTLPREVEEAGWTGLAGGFPLVPKVPFTCTAGKGRVIDFAMVAVRIVGLLQLRPSKNALWRPRFALDLCLP